MSEQKLEIARLHAERDELASIREQLHEEVAAANGGNRAAGTPGYDASAGYVAEELRRAGYAVEVQPFEVPYYEELVRTARWSKDYPLHTRYRLARDYDGVLTQCTSIALEGIKHVWELEKWERLLDPKFNIGQGFNKKVSRYYFKTQDKLNRREQKGGEGPRDGAACNQSGQRKWLACGQGSGLHSLLC